MFVRHTPCQSVYSTERAQSPPFSLCRPLLAPSLFHPLSSTGQQCARACCPVTDNSSASTIPPQQLVFLSSLCCASLFIVLVHSCGALGNHAPLRGQVSCHTSPLTSTRSLLLVALKIYVFHGNMCNMKQVHVHEQLDRPRGAVLAIALDLPRIRSLSLGDHEI